MYKLDPRSKLVFVIALTISVFFLDKILICVSLIFSLILFKFAVKLPFIKFNHFARFLFLAAVIILIQYYFGKGLSFGFVVVCRLLALFLIFPILTHTTSPYRLAAGLSALGLRYRFAFIITTALNLVPHFAEEARLIIDAQKLRGAGVYEKKRLFSVFSVTKINAYAKICLPLVLGAMKKAQTSSIAMDSRAFGVHKTRNWIEKPKMKRADYFFLTGSIIFVMLLLLLNYADFVF